MSLTLELFFNVKGSLSFSGASMVGELLFNSVAMLWTSSVESSSAHLLRSISLTVVVLTNVRAESDTLRLTSSGERSSCADFRHVGLDTVALAIAIPVDGLIVSLVTLPQLVFLLDSRPCN